MSPARDPEVGLSQSHRIAVDPERCGGRACIRDLRVRVADVLDMLAAGESRQYVLGDYLYLEDANITAALQYASRRTGFAVPKVA